jgi:hypothetical protein
LDESSEPAVRGGRLFPQEAQVHIALVALAVLIVSIAITASVLNGIAISQSETEPRRNTVTHASPAKFRGSTLDYGIPHVAMPKGKKTFPPTVD